MAGNYRLYTKDGLRDSSIGFWIPQVNTSALALSCLNIKLYDCENSLAYRHSKQNSCLNQNNSISLEICFFLLLTPRFSCDFSKRRKAKHRVCQKKCCSDVLDEENLFIEHYSAQTCSGRPANKEL